MCSSWIAPLWRSSGRCLALRSRTTGTATTTVSRPSAAASCAVTTSWKWQQIAGRRQTVASSFPAAVRGYADDATTQNGAELTDDGSTATDTTRNMVTEESLQAHQISETKSIESKPAAGGDAAVTKLTKEKNSPFRQLELLASGQVPFEPYYDGHKFGLTTALTRASTAVLPGKDNVDQYLAGGDALPSIGKVQDRYAELISQLTRLMMRHGKLAKAQREMAMILNYLRTAPTPKLDPAHPLLPGHPPAGQLPLNPVVYLTFAIDSVAPLIRIMQLSGAAGGGRSLPVPVPLAQRQRRRAAFMWILESVSKKQSRGSGRNTFATRIAEEIVAIAEGRSGLWDKRLQLHKQGTASRINTAALTSKRKMKRRL
ncbi:hypothetical protein SEPCBS57363_001907 [Sporothrix epigloea]|uniref:Small ribosomal subunit protein uS7 domain-containing protein n=1 Tax=Sporothrix epigloea TaxID=1892477 RepID=A0ABP0DFZ2_9PEZI